MRLIKCCRRKPPIDNFNQLAESARIIINDELNEQLRILRASRRNHFLSRDKKLEGLVVIRGEAAKSTADLLRTIDAMIEELKSEWGLVPEEDSQCIEITSQLNVQPLSTDELRVLSEGERTVKRIKSYGSDQMASADASTQTPGDRLFYHGQWYAGFHRYKSLPDML